MSPSVVGIDLGTTNCALSYRDLNQGRSEVLPIPQLTSPGTVEERVLLPSFLYLCRSEEFPEGSLAYLLESGLLFLPRAKKELLPDQFFDEGGRCRGLSIGCQRIECAPNAVSQAITAQANTCRTLSAAAECSRAYSPTKMMCTA